MAPLRGSDRRFLRAAAVILGAAQDVQPADQPHQAARRVDHRQPLEVAVGHAADGRAHRLVGADAHHGLRHDVGGNLVLALQLLELAAHLLGRQPGLQAQPRIETGAAQQVAVADDAGQHARVVDDRHAAIAAAQEQGDDLGDRRGRRHRRHRRTHDRLHGQVEQVGAAPGGVLHHVDRLDGDQPVLDQGAHRRQQPVDHLGLVDPLDAQGQVGREGDEGGGADAAVRAKAGQRRA